MRNIASLFLVLSLLISSTNLFAQKEVQISGKLTSCSADSLRIFVLDGVSLRQVAVMPVRIQGEDKVFSIKISKVPLGFYFLGLGQRNNTVPLILGQEEQLYLEGACDNFAKAVIGNSPMHVSLQQANQKLDSWQKEMSRLIGEYRVASRAKRDLSDIEARMAKVDGLKQGLIEDLKKTDPFIAKVVGLKVYLSYQTAGAGFSNEADYFAAKFFQFVNLADPDYNRIPQFHDAFKSYANSLGQVGLASHAIIDYAEKQVAFIPQPSSAHKAAILGLAAGFQGKDEDAFAKYAAKYLEFYPQDNPAISQQISKNLELVKNRLIGGTAPEIRLPTPEGDTLSLEDYRGKYLLVDFWASWCGPCRRENPNVRRVYAAYKDKGFEILGVSLDRSEANWLKAIEQDKLPWKHVSDLKQWKSIAAKTYGVHSIPYTVLIDPDGKIIAKRLRGAGLEKELERLLGSE